MSDPKPKIKTYDENIGDGEEGKTNNIQIQPNMKFFSNKTSDAFESLFTWSNIKYDDDVFENIFKPDNYKNKKKENIVNIKKGLLDEFDIILQKDKELIKNKIWILNYFILLID